VVTVSDWKNERTDRRMEQPKNIMPSQTVSGGECNKNTGNIADSSN